jgi:voltage-gated potassium channel
MHSVETQRIRLVVQLERTAAKPLLLLSLVWVVLAAVELTRGLSRAGEVASAVIWAIFVADFVVKLLIAPRKWRYLRDNWVAAVSLLVPAFRLVRAARVLRLARAARGLRLARLLGSINRGMRALRVALHRRAAGYVAATTLLVLFAGAAGVMAFERDGRNAAAFASYGDALWWTAMLLTTIAPERWPTTAAGRILTLFLSLYAVAVFGYVTAMLASFFVKEDKRRAPVEEDARRLH